MSDLSAILFDWYARCGRDLPWRRTRDPYRIWLSEIILQQTRVTQGMDYYLRFIRRFPDVATLAAASEDEVLKLWQGLGYYSRARNLHAAARRIVSHFDGMFPVKPEDVRSLRGVGEYTAAAICSAAYGTPCAVLDGNSYRVLSRIFDVAVPVDTAAGRKAFSELAHSLLAPENPGLYNQAIMDFGALQCTPVQPRCEACPLAERCLARAAGTIGERPVKRSRTKVRNRWFHYVHPLCSGETLLHRRGAGDIWQGLYEFPLIETPEVADFDALAATEAFEALSGGMANIRSCRTFSLPPHRLSHQTLHAAVHRIELHAWPMLPDGYLRIEESDLDTYAVPRLLERYLLECGDRGETPNYRRSIRIRP